MKKLKVLALLTMSLSVLSSIPAFAAGWQKNDTGWWYTLDDNNTNWYESGWVWIDGNLDGVAECYYFQPNGYLAVNTTIGGYTVNSDGAWTIDGVAQIRTEANGDEFDGMTRKNYQESSMSDLNNDGKITAGEYRYYFSLWGATGGVDTSNDRKDREEHERYLKETYGETSPDEQIDLEEMQKEIDEWTRKEAEARMRIE